MIEYVPWILAAISIIGSAAAFILSYKGKKELDSATATHEISQSYKELIESLEKRVGRLEDDLHDEKRMRRKAEGLVEELTRRVSALERENEMLRSENEEMKEELAGFGEED